MTNDDPKSFENGPITPAVGSEESLTEGFQELREKALEPRFWTDAPPNEAGRIELVRGAELLRLHGPRALRGARIHGHQVLLSDILDAPHEVLALLEPRRSFKTSTLFAKALGRISGREDYKVAYTMTTRAIKARTRFRDDIVRPLEALYPDKDGRPFKIVKAGGSERIEWIDTGSVFAFLAPKGDAFRSDAWDWIILDEGGEARPEVGEDLLDAAPQTQDTREGAHITIAGTGPQYREGNLLWDALELARAGTSGYSILDYSAVQTLTVADIDTWEKAVPYLLEVHPTAGVVSDIGKIERNYHLSGPESFHKEYLGVAGWGTGEDHVFNLSMWGDRLLVAPQPKAPPADSVMAVQVHRHQKTAAIVFAWREDGAARVLVVDERPGVEWFAKRAHELAVKHRKQIVHDVSSPVKAEVQQIKKLTPGVRFLPQQFADVQTAAALIVKEVDLGNVWHWEQPVLNEAVRVAKKRSSNSWRGWALGTDPENPDDDITTIEAASLALRVYDEKKPVSGVGAKFVE